MDRRCSIISGYVATAIASLIISSSVHAMTANEFLPLCKMAVKQFDENPNGGSQFDQFNIGYCLGAVHALRNASQFLTESQTCPPTKASDLQVVKVAVSYIEKNPSQLQEPFEFFVVEAMIEAWPCKK